MEGLPYWAPLFGAGGLIVALIIYLRVASKDPGTGLMVEIADEIQAGAMVYLKRQYSILLFFVAAIAVLIYFVPTLGPGTAAAYVSGAICSIAAGFFGMKSATKANVRTAQAADMFKPDSAKALSTAFNGGAVMGLAITSIGLIGVGTFFYLFGNADAAFKINGFAMGASSIALFMRVGGGIYTKTADVGADLVGKVEAGIPEDDPRNPGVIADNVGDNVGDVAGLGADLFESYVGSIIATIALGATAVAGSKIAALGNSANLMSLPIVIAIMGFIASVLGILSMRVLEKFSPAAALRYSTFIAAALFLVFSYFVCNKMAVDNQVFWAIFIGSLGGISIGLLTEYYTAAKPIRDRSSSRCPSM